MKKFFYSIIAAATMLFATTSCSQDELINNGDTPQGGNGQKVTFKVEMPAEDAASRSIADGVSVGGGNMADNLIWALYEQGKDKCLDCGHVTGEKNEESNGKHEFTVDITMVKGLTYNILFFAYDADNCAFKLESKPEETDLTALTLVDNLVANNEGYDAFVKCHTYKFGGQTTVELTRPFAQVNAATTEADLTRAKQLEAVVTKSELVIKNVPTQYNVLTGEATANSDLTYSATEILKHYVSGNESPVHPNEEIVIEEEGVENTYYYLAMAYVLAGETADSEQSMHNATFNFYRGENGDDPMRTIDILNLPIQRNWRTNVIGALLTEEESFKIVIDHKFVDDHIIKEDEIAYVTTSVDLEEALREDLQTIIVNLGEETDSRAEGEKLTFELKIGAWTEQYYWGSSQTKTIIINGNGHTINFVHENGDWNYIRCINDDATWCFNNVHLTNSGKNNGPWNRHDIRFYNAVELQNVTSDKAIAVLNDATLKNVKITEDQGVYGLWITAEGQTVDVDGLEIVTSKDGRGIAIKDEYVDNPELVTLNVKNSKFTTQSKAAVLVTSTAGANITWGEGNDISGVAADNVNAVWVDEDREAYMDKVIVSGCSMIVEGYETIANGLLKKDKTYAVATPEGLVALSQITIAGSESVKLIADIDLSGVDFTGLSAFNPESNNTFDGQGHTISNWTYEGGAADMGFLKLWVGPIKNINFENCHLKTGGRSAVVAANTYTNIDNVKVNNCSVEDTYWACGIIAGMLNSGNVSNCVVTNSSVKSNGGTGGIVGVLNETAGTRTFTNCSVSGTTINNTGIYGDAYSGAAILGMINISASTVKFIGCSQENNKFEGTAKDAIYNCEDEDITIVVE